MTTAACGFGISENFNAVLRFFIIFCAVLRFSDLPYAPLAKQARKLCIFFGSVLYLNIFEVKLVTGWRRALVSLRLKGKVLRLQEKIAKLQHKVAELQGLNI